MQFNFKKYITEKYLTEKLQSDILVHEILDDTGEMFTYYKMNNKGTIYSKACKCYNQLVEIINTLRISDIIHNKDNTITCKINLNNSRMIYNSEDHIDTPEKVVALHKKYMDLYTQFCDYISKLFIKPDPLLLPAICTVSYEYKKVSFNTNIRDIYNITDENFSKYTLNEIKADKNLKQKLINDINTNTVFWFNKDKKIVAVTVNGYMVLFAKDNPIYYNLSRNDIDKLCSTIDKDFVTYYTLHTYINDDITLDWPVIKPKNYDTDNKGFLTIKSLLDLSINSDFGILPERIGMFTSKASKLYKNSKWGDNGEDYIIVYKPEQEYKDANGNVLSTYSGTSTPITSLDMGYNDAKASTIYNRTLRDRKNAYEYQVTGTYKWIKNILGKYKPYAGGKDNPLFKYGVIISDSYYYNTYKDDVKCMNIAYENYKKYKLIIEKNKSLNKLTDFNTNLQPVLNAIRTHTASGKILMQKIKEFIQNNTVNTTPLFMLYDTYMKLLSTVLSDYTLILNDILVLKSVISKTKNNEDYTSDNASYLISRRANIINKINSISKLCDELQEFNKKINETMKQ